MAGACSFQYRSRPHNDEGGFSLVELVIVLVLIGVLSALALPKLSGGAFDDRGFRDAVTAALRYSQKSAIAAHRRVCVTFTANSATFSIAANFADANCAGGSPLIGPDGSNLALTATGNAAFSAVPADIVFDAAGRPVTGAAVPINFTNLPAALAVTVAAETGYVY